MAIEEALFGVLEARQLSALTAEALSEAGSWALAERRGVGRGPAFLFGLRSTPLLGGWKSVRPLVLLSFFPERVAKGSLEAGPVKAGPPISLQYELPTLLDWLPTNNMLIPEKPSRQMATGS